MRSEHRGRAARLARHPYPRLWRDHHGGPGCSACQPVGADDWRVALSVSPRAEPGIVRDRIVVETGSSVHPRLIVPIVGTVVESAERGGEGRTVR